MRVIDKAALLLAIALLGGCSTPSRADATTDTRAAIGKDCIKFNVDKDGKELAPLLGALISAVAPALIDKGLDVAASAIRKAAEKEEANANVVVAEHFHYVDFENETAAINPDMRCLIIARGRVDGDRQFDAAGNWTENRVQNDLKERLGIVGDPDFYLEVQIAFASDHTAFRLVPRHLEFRKPMKGSGERALSITVSFSVPSSPSGGKTFALGTLNFPEIAPDETRVWDHHALRGKDTAWLPVLAPAEAPTTLIKEWKAATGSLRDAKKLLSHLQDIAGDDDRKQEYERLLGEIKQLEAAIKARKLAFDPERIRYQDAYDSLADGTTTKTDGGGNTTTSQPAARNKAAAKRAKERLDAFEEIRAKDAMIAEKKMMIARPLVELGWGIDDEIGQLIKKMPSLSNAVASIEKRAATTPFTTDINIVETEDANQFLLAIADAFDQAQPVLAEAAKNKLDPSARAAQREAKALQRQTEDIARIDARLAVLTAEQALEKAEAELARIDQDTDELNYILKQQEIARLRLALEKAKIANSLN